VPLATRALVMVDRWWRLVDAGRDAEAVRTHAELRRLEVALQLSPAERTRAGIQPAVAPPRPPGSRSRARLRAVDGDGSAG
jgi:hypothetical protein